MSYDRRKFLLDRLAQLPLEELEDLVQGCDNRHQQAYGSSFVGTSADDLSQRAQQEIINDNFSEVQAILNQIRALPGYPQIMNKLALYAKDHGRSEIEDYIIDRVYRFMRSDPKYELMNWGDDNTNQSSFILGFGKKTQQPYTSRAELDDLYRQALRAVRNQDYDEIDRLVQTMKKFPHDLDPASYITQIVGFNLALNHRGF